MSVELTVSKVDRGQRSEGSDHNEIDHNSLKYILLLEYNVPRVSYKKITAYLIAHNFGKF